MNKDALEGLISLLDNWAAIFTLLVVIGVGGELVVHMMSSSANKKLIALQNSEALSQGAEIARLKHDSSSLALDIATANERAAVANERAETEANARAAMLSQLQPRTFTKEQMHTFVAEIKGKVIELNVFTLPDPEAAQYGFQIIDGLQKAGVRVDWYPTMAPYFSVPGVSSSGLTLYESPNKHVTQILMGAFLKIGQSSMRLTPENPSDQDQRLPAGATPLSSIPSPALFVALKQPAFTSYPEYLRTPEVKIRKPPWE